MIRTATLEDSTTIAHYNLHLAKESENLILDINRVTAGVSWFIAHPEQGHYFLFEEDKNIIGQLMITYEWSDWRCGMFWWIQSVYVHPSHRNKGVFKSLYTYVKERCEADPLACGMRLYVEKNNVSAQSTYEKCGMHKTHYDVYEWEK